MNSYLTVSGECVSEYTEKRSRFIATVRHCSSEEEALKFVEAMRSKYWDARHNVFAYSINNSVSRFSDDGEPHGTAGKPVLDIIKGSKVTDVAVVVTRYFGGVLLGTGGLVRAYSKAARDAVLLADIVEMTPCIVITTFCKYTDHGKLTGLISSCGGVVDDTQFDTEVKLSYHIKSSESELFMKKLSEAFSARITADIQDEKLYPFKCI